MISQQFYTPGQLLVFAAMAALWIAAGLPARADDVPPPSETPCSVVVSGRTSTLKSIVIKKVGQSIPTIYHGKFTCKNTPGFDWYVSQHFALKANVGDALADRFLTLAELAYPHYVEVFGREPDGIATTRLCMVHATDINTLQQAIVSDIGEKWVGNGGGVTLPHSFAAYNYPSGTLDYHRNDISLHEGLHLFQLVLEGNLSTPNRFTEGITHAFANHVYDPEKKQLTVAVFDKAPINNPIEAGLKLFREKGAPEMQELIDEKMPKDYYPSAVALSTAFFWSQPDRLMKWRIWRDEMLQAAHDGKDVIKADGDVMRKLYGGSLDGLNREWHDWLIRRHATFTHVDWGWEQWGDTLQSYGWPWNDKFFSQMNINHAPGLPWPADPYRMDYPRSPRPALVDPVQVGVEEPSVGCVLGFAPNKGWAGMGFGVDGRYLMRVAVDRGQSLVMDGTLLAFGSGRVDTAFTPAVLDAARKAGRLGLSVRIGKMGVTATVRAGEGGELREMSATYLVSPTERQDLLTRPMALLSRDARHRITPFVDEPPAQVDLLQPAPANRWRFAGDWETYRLYRAAWRLGDKAPGSLLSLRDAMVAAMDKDPATQEKAMQEYRRLIGTVEGDVKGLGVMPDPLG